MKKKAGTLKRIAHVLCGFALPCLLFAQPVKEEMLKAAFTYNFILFTEWPEQVMENAKALTLCVNPTSEMKAPLLSMEGKALRHWHLRVQMLDWNTTQLRQCHVLYLDRADQINWHKHKHKIENMRVLTISEDAGIARDGAMILLARNGSKLVFDINQGAVQRSGLLLSSKLLRLARRVH